MDSTPGSWAHSQLNFVAGLATQVCGFGGAGEINVEEPKKRWRRELEIDDDDDHDACHRGWKMISSSELTRLGLSLTHPAYIITSSALVFCSFWHPPCQQASSFLPSFFQLFSQ